MTGETPRISVAEALARAAQEARLLADEAALLDDGLGQALAQLPGAAPKGVQGADALRQGLGGLACFLDALATTLDDAGTCAPARAAAGLELRAQVLRLGSGASAPGPAGTAAPPGDELWLG